MGANLFCLYCGYEQMRSIASLKRPVLLDGSKFRLRNLFGKPSVSQALLKVSS